MSSRCGGVVGERRGEWQVAAELSYMSAYLVPEKITALSTIPRGEDGAVDEEALAARIEKMNARAAPGGGGGEGEGSVLIRVTTAIHRVTNVMAEAEDTLASTLKLVACNL